MKGAKTVVPGISVRDASGVTVLDFAEGGCHPANDTELAMLARIAELEAAMLECNSRLNTLSMALTGGERACVCIANNFLNRALGREEHFVASNYSET